MTPTLGSAAPTAVSAPWLRLTADHRRSPLGRVMVIGTAETAALIGLALDGLAESPEVVGRVVVGGGAGKGTASGVDELPGLLAAQRPETAVVCLPGVMSEARRRVSGELRRAGVRERIITTIADQLLGGWAGDGSCGADGAEAGGAGGAGAAGGVGGVIALPPRIDLGMLVGREPYTLDRDAVGRVLGGKRVLVTGAGGSIGSELARVAATFGPEQLVLMERSENALFEIDRQIAARFPGVRRRAVLHDVVEEVQTARLLSELRPHVVFHSAAHKHVPLMEDHPAHALANNFFGTKAIADAAAACGAERFVMISTDKAVNPSSVMGATKRLAEVYIRCLARRAGGADRGGGADWGGGTRFSMVRFGNVLGSAASVLTIWSQQLAEGGPITVTDPRMTRYFMTIPEAATLVAQSTALRTNLGLDDAAPVYVLDMGAPVRIVDLAARFVRAHGLRPRIAGGEPGAPDGSAAGEIEIAFTGARPGEKLHEELAYAEELLSPTDHPGIRAWAPGAGWVESDLGASAIDELSAARYAAGREAVVEAIRRYVPEMTATPRS